MKAILQERYGGPETLSLRDVDVPEPGPGQVLVGVRAASLNARDWHIMRGDPWVVRLSDRQVFGRRGPRHPVRGSDVAGVVEAVGPGVTEVAVGAEVLAYLGPADGAFAELALAPVGSLAPKPEGLSFEQAASLPLAATTACTGLAGVGRVAAGQRVLVNGASGGVGTFAVQVGTALGAEVTVVCSGRNAALAASLGATRVVDYTAEDFATEAVRYDVVLDLVGNRSLRDLRRVLAPAGTLLLSGGGTSEGGSLLGPMRLFLAAELRSRFVRPQRLLSFLAEPDAADLGRLGEMVADGSLRPVVDRTYPLAALPDAMRYLEEEHARGKVAITV